ncbi:Dipeptide transport system permease protein DppB [Prochlorococcus marinus str. MIT 9123]|uniref:Dipeptide transport system permease protein DppB n=1 Tax=Prochlorococcus marinus str. MIT 9116 TaxID=167544 RepID=A0A0A1ZMD2_PROMR|nr:ABC transporter permease [Prochlorococcus marinus]KGF90762.1 Dipeptide transport system permease protein DppB [Prochlorococcus marinus str. MIT 9116]KGF93676.1 Dipeptide transport system permease protein DppB [Prochlorococcus marinus str. MIT 9123]
MSRNLKKLLNYSLLKISLIPIMLWIISSLVFILLRVAPGDPVDAIIGSGADEVSREFLRNKLGLNEPLINQYFSYIQNILHLDFGQSLSTQEPVLNIILKSFPASLELCFFSILSATLIGFPLGLIGLRNRGKKTDYILRILGIATYSIPPFWGAMLAQLLFSVFFKVSPIGGRFPIFQQQPQITGFLVLDSILSNNIIALKDSLYHLALPSITLGFLLSGIFSRSLRVNLDKTLKSDYVNAAICRGISRKKIFLNHALPNALLPIVTISGLTMASLAGGALLFEVTFSWPGIALRLHEAISQRDYTLVQGIVIFTSILIVSLNLFVDILIAYLDPRIEY